MRSGEEKRAPFGAILPFCEQLLLASLEGPGLELFFAFRFGVLEFPLDMTASVTTDPLAVEINVEVNVEATVDVHSQVRSRDRLPQSRSRRDW